MYDYCSRRYIRSLDRSDASGVSWVCEGSWMDTSTHLHELDAGLERVIESEEEQKVLLHREELRELQKGQKGDGIGP